MESITKKLGTLLLVVTFSFNAFAEDSSSIITPESGWWWNPDESGTGYAIEIQDNIAFLATYTYDPIEKDGVRRPIWFTASGVLIDDDVYEGELLLVEDGQCIGCAHQAPTISSTEGHDIRIEFLSRTTAEVTIDGEVTPIQRFEFGWGGDINKKLLGEWSLTINASSNFDFYERNRLTADMLVFDELVEDDGDILIYGCRIDNINQGYCTDEDTENSLAIALYYPESDAFYIVVDESSLEWRAYWMSLDTSRASGLADQFNKSGGSFDFDEAAGFLAYRSASGSFAQTQTGPAKPQISGVQELTKMARATAPPAPRANLTEYEKQQLAQEAFTKLQAKLLENR
ncbi:hypothetical protein QWI17_19670 [Gilvimarinus sp. SDUM040013]|uniref:Uncharacterized protein n=1 Tax=Gilvimarinus gilvus TaxID=3058038 RepID=A0ABU4S3A6_9GAMM|nr:hypothetical protein [Gilvimarinus sp. SDUM040013]MDO3388074.1 hypothetical protein [Gilvimarinus sp. SDUM040013]MDX6850982.1 hypothetical protein [Gilvimarinus sp. SDUM040013]